MILPVGDSPNPPGTAWVTYTVIAINVLVYLLTLPLGARAADPRDPEFVRYLQVVGEERGLGREQLRQLGLQVSEYDLLVFERGFRPAQPSPVDLLTSIFLHAGLMHLAGNMLFLWIYGDNVEHRLGRLGFALLYLATGVVASGGDALLRAGSNLPSVGASGAISGVLGLYFLWFPHNRVRLWFLLPPFVQIFELPARVVLGFYLVVENLWPLLWSRGDGGISYGAHIGGFVAGLTAAFLISRLAEARPERDLRGGPRATIDGAREFDIALARGEWARAAEWFFATPHSATRRTVGAAAKVRLGELLARNGHPHAALAAFQRALADHPVDDSRPAAHLGAAQVLLDDLANPTGAYQHLYEVLDGGATPDQETTARRLLERLASSLRNLPRGPRR